VKTRIVCSAFACALSLTALPAAAQSPISIGPMAGVSFYTFTGNDADIYGTDLGANFSKGSRVGFIGGGFAEFEFGKVFAIEPQVLYVQKGAKYDVQLTDGSGSASATLKLDYIQVPLLFKAEYREAGRDYAPSLFVGPAIAFKTSCKITASAAGQSASEDCATDTVNSTDFSLIFGLGFELSKFVLQARYDLGLTNVPQESGVDLKNGGFAITLGYGFALK
jgi:hypothetical protein